MHGIVAVSCRQRALTAGKILVVDEIATALRIPACEDRTLEISVGRDRAQLFSERRVAQDDRQFQDLPAESIVDCGRTHYNG